MGVVVSTVRQVSVIKGNAPQRDDFVRVRSQRKGERASQPEVCDFDNVVFGDAEVIRL